MNRPHTMLHPLPLGRATLAGRVGDEIALVLGARVRSPFAAEAIAPEATEAFRRRVDDRLRPGHGLWQGEFWGKWILSALAAYRYTGDRDLLATIRRETDALLATQDDDGYVGTYHDSAFVVPRPMENGKLGNNWNVWCRKYTLWGLVEAYEVLGDPAILNAAQRFADHLMSEVGPGAVPIHDTGKFVGLPSSSILSPLLRLFGHTQDERSLRYADYIVDQFAADEDGPPDLLRKGLGGEPIHTWFDDPGSWTKAYELISCVEGMVDLYRVTGRAELLTAAANLHRALREHERVIFGGLGRNDKLLQAARLLETEAEVCDAVYWNRLSAQLLALTGEAVYADEIERTLYNVLLAAMNDDGTWGVRRLCLNGEHWPAPPHCELQHHHCCVDNLPRGLLQIAEVAVMAGPGSDELTVNLYLPGEYHVPMPVGEARLRIETDYPEGGVVRLTLESAAAPLTLRLRIPPWAGEPGYREQPCAPGEAFTLRLDLAARTVPFPGDGPPHVAVMRGPLVLARDIRVETDIHEPVALASDAEGCLPLRRVDAPDGFWMVFEAPTRDGGTIRLCDYASAGQTWERATSDFRVWLPVRHGG